MSVSSNNFSRPFIGLYTVLLLGFALIFTATAESAQNSKGKAKATPTPKKSAKATPTPKKNAQAKATPTPKKNDKKQDKATDKNKKTTASKTTEKSSAKNSKDAKKSSTTASKSADKNKKSNDKSSDKSKDKSAANKNSAKKDSSKSKSNSAKNDSTKKKSDSSTSAKTTTPKSDRKTTATKTTTKKISAPKPDSDTPKSQPDASEIIVTNVSARLRSQAKTTASEVSRVKLGTILTATEKNSSWYKVKYTADGKTANGWISADSVENLKTYKRSEIYRQIVDGNYKTQMDFPTAAELTDFLSGINGEDSTAELELKRLTVLRETLRKIPVEQTGKSPYREFLKSHEKEIIYSEPTGEWYVGSNKFWDLHKKYKSDPSAEKIAWEAAQNPLPGECEGYINCRLFYARMTSGEYLRLHPQGAKSSDALKDLENFLEPIAADSAQKKTYQLPSDANDRAEFNNLIAELKTIVTRLALPEKNRTLQQLKQIGDAFK